TPYDYHCPFHISHPIYSPFFHFIYLFTHTRRSDFYTLSLHDALPISFPLLNVPLLLKVKYPRNAYLSHQSNVEPKTLPDIFPSLILIETMRYDSDRSLGIVLINAFSFHPFVQGSITNKTH